MTRGLTVVDACRGRNRLTCLTLLAVVPVGLLPHQGAPGVTCTATSARPCPTPAAQPSPAVTHWSRFMFFILGLVDIQLVSIAKDHDICIHVSHKHPLDQYQIPARCKGLSRGPLSHVRGRLRSCRSQHRRALRGNGFEAPVEGTAAAIEAPPANFLKTALCIGNCASCCVNNTLC